MHDSLVALAPHFCRLHPFRPMHGTILLVEKLTFHAIWIALHCERTVLQVRQKRRGNADVVVDHLRLGETRLRIKHFVQVRYLKFPVVDDKFSFLRHGQAKRPTSNPQRPTSNLEGALKQKSARAGGRAWVYKFGQRNAPSFRARSGFRFPRARNKWALSDPPLRDAACAPSLFRW